MLMKRRGALKALGLAAGAAFTRLATVADAEEVRARVNTHSEPTDLKITDLRVSPIHHRGHRHILRLDTNQGISGYGEIRDGASATYALMLKSRVLGENPCHVDRIFRKIKQFGGHGRQAGGVVGVEIACWDLAGKAWGVPCWQMLGGQFRNKVRMYADTEFHPDPKEMAHRLTARRERGFTFLKMDFGIQLLEKLADGLTYPHGQGGPTGQRPWDFAARGPHLFTGMRISDRGLRQLQDYLAAVRDAAGWDIPLAADHFGHFGVEDAIKLAQALDPFNLAWLEDLIPWINTDDYVRLKNACKTPILTGEDIYLKEEFLKLFQKKAISICHPDLMTSGGLLETKKIADLALEHGIPMAMHMAGSPVGLMASVHCAATAENFLALEFHDCDTPYYDDLVEGLPKPLVGKDGFAAVPNKPGLGIELNEQAVKDMLRRSGQDPQKVFFPPTDEWNRERSGDRLWSRYTPAASLPA